MKHKLLFILLIAGLVAGKALLADKSDTTEAQKHLKPFNCENPVEGELLLQLRTDTLQSNKLLRLNQSNQFEVATYTKIGEQIFEQQNIPQISLQRAFETNKFEVTEVVPIQAMFKDGENFGKSPENAKDILREVRSPITKISFKQIQRTKKGEEILAYPTKTVTKDFIKRLKKALSQDVKFVSEVCRNVEPTTAPAMPDDPVYAWGDQWGLWNFGAIGGIPDLDMNYTPAWQKLYSIWQLYPADQIVMSIIGAGIDDRPTSPTFQNEDLENVVAGSYVVPGIGGGNYYDYLTEQHELQVTGVAIAGNHNGRGITGVTKGKIFLSVFNDGVTPLTSADLIDAIDQASLTSEIINASYMVRGDDPAIRAILETIAARGDVAIFGAGNNGVNLNDPGAYNGGYPCRYNHIPGLNINIICVAGMGWNGALATFGGVGSSNYGEPTLPGELSKVHLAAPAGDIMTTVDGAYTFVSGTSYAAPFISGLMSFVKWYRPSLTLNEIKQIIIDPANRRDAPAPSTLPVATGGIPDFLKVLNHAESLRMCGDSDNDARITVMDAFLIARASAGMGSVDRIQADVNGDGNVSITDALSVARYVVGLPDQLACPGD